MSRSVREGVWLHDLGKNKNMGRVVMVVRRTMWAWSVRNGAGQQ